MDVTLKVIKIKWKFYYAKAAQSNSCSGNN